jgi:hypothetical protein
MNADTLKTVADADADSVTEEGSVAEEDLVTEEDSVAKEDLVTEEDSVTMKTVAEEDARQCWLDTGEDGGQCVILAYTMKTVADANEDTRRS